jgi:hypothetical protein
MSMRHISALRAARFWLGLLPLLVSACANTTFKVEHAPNVHEPLQRIATFGVERDGVLHRDGWGALGPGAPAPFNAQYCDVAFGEATFAARPALAQALDNYVRTNGVTDELLARLAPASQSDAILFVVISGQTPVSGGLPPQMQGMRGGAVGGGAGGGGSRGGGGGGRGRGNRGADASSGSSSAVGGDGLYASAWLYSVREHHNVARLDMRYTGASASQGLRAFRDRVEQEFPQAHCVNWSWSQPIDPSAILALP